jgi:AraC-like DNA-binding protein
MNNFSKYLLSDNLEADWGFYITTVGYTKIDTNQSYPPNSQHPESHKFNWDTGRILEGYYLVFISKGEGIFESGQTKNCSVKEGTCFLLFPGVWHRYKPNINIGWEEYWVGFKGSYPDLLIKNFDANNPFIQTGRNDSLLSLFHTLLEKVQQASPGYHQVITGITLQMLGLLQAVIQYPDLSKGNAKQMIEEAKFLLREAVQNPDKIENIVKKLPIGYSKLRRDFKNSTGQSPNQYLLNLKLDKAKELLTGTNLSISEIAYQVGFESLFYFSKQFKNKNGISPKFYRK